MQSPLFQSVPANTARAAKTVFNIENLYLAIGDQLDNLFGGLNLNDLDDYGEKPAYSLFILAMVTLFQCAEGIPDRQAADAVRTRLDWKYALHLPLDYPSIDYTALREFRRRLRLNRAGLDVFQHMLTRLVKLGLWGSEDNRRMDIIAILATVDTLSRVDETAATMSLALEALASRQPEWLRTISLPHWYERYSQLFTSQRLPGSEQELDVMVQAVRTDMFYLLKEIGRADATDLILLPEVQALEQICQQQFQPQECEG
jgi:transposase